MDASTLARATKSSTSNAQKYCDPLNETMEKYSIDSNEKIAAFLATLTVESINLSTVEESLYYKDAARLASIYKRKFNSAAQAQPYTRNSAALSQLLYEGFHGRGLIQITWKDNYLKAGKALGFDYIANPDLLLQPWHAAMTAGWFWDTNKINVPASKGDMDTVTRLVNGPAKMHLAERKAAYKHAMSVLR